MDFNKVVDSSPFLNNVCMSNHHKLRTSAEKQIFKNEVRQVLNPIQRLESNLVFVIPVSWYMLLQEISNSKIPYNLKIKYLKVKDIIENFMFPDIKPNKIAINVSTLGINDPQKGILEWFEFFHLPISLKSCKSNKIDHIKSVIFHYLKCTGVSKTPFMLILSYSKISRRKIHEIHQRIGRQLKERHSTNHLFTVHLQDQESPFILFWLDTENICSFNLSLLNNPKEISEFVNTFILFVNYSISNLTSLL